ncbi:Opacity protein and related surface antigens [Legionella beliardensis]|uniref:Opacity protein and related surface antigens n=1 Tax=Legionella beliardensis TaxID=91822 RepID=A0A378I0S4_9GAMM|nr:outer membrane beta-barrel protein [Legionella beliardensis]STX28583.1 Opacity protein and related surface antigens [Legionella beliardensis]
MLGKISTGLLLSLSIAPSFAGFYIGASTGPEGALFYQRSHVTRFSPFPLERFDVIDKNRFAGVGGFGSIFAGYGWSRDRFYLGIEGNANISSLEYKLTNDEYVHQNFSKTTFTIKRSFGVSFLPGYLLSETTLFYGRVGYANGRLKIKESDPSINSSTNDLDGIRFGLGVRHAFTPKWIGMMDYSQTHYDHVISHTFDPFGSVAKHTKITPYTAQVAFGLIYSFDDPAPVYVK